MGNTNDSMLYEAARKGDIDSVRAALKNGADPNPHLDETSPHGWSPLHVAANYNKRDVCKMLLYRKADINAQDKHGDTPLDLAAKRGSHVREELERVRCHDPRTSR